MSIVAKSQQFVEVDQKIKDLKDQLKKAEDEKREIEASLLEQMAEEGMQSIKLDSGATVYLHRQVWASAVDQDKLCHVLDELGLASMVKTAVNAQTLSSWVREHERDLDAQSELGVPGPEADVLDQFDLPEEVRDLLKVTEKFQVRARRS